MNHPDLDPSAQNRLQSIVLGTAPPLPDPTPGHVTSEPDGGPGRRERLVRRVREATRPVAEPALDRLASIVAGRLRHSMRSEYNYLVAAVELMRAEQTTLRRELDGTAAFGASAAAHRLDSLEINLELMKGQIGAFQSTLDDFGNAIAPTAGLGGVPHRFAELREQVNALDRQVRAAASPTAPSMTSTPRPADELDPEPQNASFDYVGFERRFRGDSESVLATLAERYSSILAGQQPVLDFGCGRGELVQVLADQGIDAMGVDPDAGMIEEAIGHGRKVHLGDGLAYLRSLAPHSLGALISVHVVEHLPFGVLVELFDLAATRLRPGGIFIAETPNPMSLIVLGNSYILDPTHVWPLHPSLLTFLAERSGFRDVDLRFYSPAEAYRLASIDAGADAPAWVADINIALERLNHVLFGPQEYALIARTPPA